MVSNAACGDCRFAIPKMIPTKYLPNLSVLEISGAVNPPADVVGSDEVSGCLKHCCLSMLEGELELLWSASTTHTHTCIYLKTAYMDCLGSWDDLGRPTPLTMAILFTVVSLNHGCGIPHLDAFGPP